MYNSMTAEELKAFLSRTTYKHELRGEQRRKKVWEYKRNKERRKEN